LRCCEPWVCRERLCVFFDVDRLVDGDRLDRPELFLVRAELFLVRAELFLVRAELFLVRAELFLVRAELFLARADALDDDFVLREPFEDERRPRVVASFALARSLATDMFNLSTLGFAC
jgi:hypothetical protein